MFVQQKRATPQYFTGFLGLLCQVHPGQATEILMELAFGFLVRREGHSRIDPEQDAVCHMPHVIPRHILGL